MNKGMKLLRNIMLGALLLICAAVVVVIVMAVNGDEGNGERVRVPREPIAEPVVHEAEDSLIRHSGLQRAQNDEFWTYLPFIPDDAVPGDIVMLSVPAEGFVSWEADVEILGEPSTANFVRASFVLPEGDFTVAALYEDTPNESEGVFLFNYDGMDHGDEARRWVPRHLDCDSAVCQFYPECSQPLTLHYAMFGNAYDERIVLSGFPSDSRLSSNFEIVGGPADLGLTIHYDTAGQQFIFGGTPRVRTEDAAGNPIYSVDHPDRVVASFTITVQYDWIEHYTDDDGNPATRPHTTIVNTPVTIVILPRPIIEDWTMPDGMVGVDYGNDEDHPDNDRQNTHYTRINVDFDSAQFPPPPSHPEIPAIAFDGLHWEFRALHDGPASSIFEPFAPMRDNPFADIRLRERPAAGMTEIHFTLEARAYAPHPGLGTERFCLEHARIDEHADCDPGICTIVDSSRFQTAIFIGSVSRSFTINILPRPYFTTGNEDILHAMDARMSFEPTNMRNPQGQVIVDAVGNEILFANEPNTILYRDGTPLLENDPISYPNPAVVAAVNYVAFTAMPNAISMLEALEPTRTFNDWQNMDDWIPVLAASNMLPGPGFAEIRAGILQALTYFLFSADQHNITINIENAWSINAMRDNFAELGRNGALAALGDIASNPVGRPTWAVGLANDFLNLASALASYVWIDRDGNHIWIDNPATENWVDSEPHLDYFDAVLFPVGGVDENRIMWELTDTVIPDLAGMRLSMTSPTPSTRQVALSGIPQTYGNFPITVRINSYESDNPNIRTTVEETFDLVIWRRTYLHIAMDGGSDAFVRRGWVERSQGSLNHYGERLNVGTPELARQYLGYRAVMPGTLGIISSELGPQGFVRWEHDRFQTQHIDTPAIGGSVGSNLNLLSGHTLLTGHEQSASHAYMTMRMPAPRDAWGNLAPTNPAPHVYIRGFQTNVPRITADATHLIATTRTEIASGMVVRPGVETDRLTWRLALDDRDLDEPRANRSLTWIIPQQPENPMNNLIVRGSGFMANLNAEPAEVGTFDFSIGIYLYGTMRIDRDVRVNIRPRGILYGDFNEDSSVNYADLILFARRATLGDAVPFPNLETADVNGDGRVDGLDFMIMARHFAIRGEPTRVAQAQVAVESNEN